MIFRDTQDLLEICAYYLEHEDERKAIAQRGQLFVQRMIDMFSSVQRAACSVQSEMQGRAVAFSRRYP